MLNISKYLLEILGGQVLCACPFYIFAIKKEILIMHNPIFLFLYFICIHYFSSLNINDNFSINSSLFFVFTVECRKQYNLFN